MTRVTVLGTGNVGHGVAAHLGQRGIPATMANLPDRAQVITRLQRNPVIDYQGVLGEGRAPVAAATTDIAAAVEDADVIVLAVPAYGHAAWFDRLDPLLRRDQILVGIACFTAWRARRSMPRAQTAGALFAELGTSPHPCRSFAPGTAELMGKRKALPVATADAGSTAAVVARLGALFDDVTAASSPLATSLGATNPVMHAPLMLLNAGRVEGAESGSWNLFRDGATPAVMATMMACDDERAAIAAAAGIAVKGVAETLKAAQNLPDTRPETVSRYYRSSPMHIDPRHHTPDSLAYRYLLEDVPFGFGPWSAIGRRLGTPTPTLDALIRLYEVNRLRIGGAPAQTLADLGITDWPPR